MVPKMPTRSTQVAPIVPNFIVWGRTSFKSPIVASVTIVVDANSGWKDV